MLLSSPFFFFSLQKKSKLQKFLHNIYNLVRFDGARIQNLQIKGYKDSYLCYKKLIIIVHVVSRITGVKCYNLKSLMKY